MRQLHHLDVDVELRVRRPIVERYHLIDPVDLSDQRLQFRLHPDGHLARDFPQRLGEANELDGIAKPVIAANQHKLIAEIFASPYPLKMALSSVLDRAGKAIFAQASVA